MDDKTFFEFNLLAPSGKEWGYFRFFETFIYSFFNYSKDKKNISEEFDFTEGLKEGFPVFFKICILSKKSAQKESEYQRLKLLIRNPEFIANIKEMREKFGLSSREYFKEGWKNPHFDFDIRQYLDSVYRQYDVEDFLHHCLDVYAYSGNSDLSLKRFKELGSFKVIPYWRLDPFSEILNLRLSKYATAEDIKSQWPAIKRLRNATGQMRFSKRKQNIDKYLQVLDTNFGKGIEDGYLKVYDLADDLFSDNSTDLKKLNRIRQYRYRLKKRYSKKAVSE